MSSLKKTIAGFLLVLIVAAGLLAVWWDNRTDEMYQDSFQSSYNYELSIETNATLNNVTLYVPVPVHGNSSSLGEKMVTGDFHADAPGWNFTIVETQYGPMLGIETTSITPRYRAAPVPISEGEEPAEQVITGSDSYSEETPIPVPVSFHIMETINRTIDTKEPIGNEPVLQPRFDQRESGNEDRVPTPENIDPQYYDYEGRIYAQYETSPYAEVEIYVAMYGINEWWTLGWTSNEYRDSMRITLNGSQDGWTPASGELVTGDGLYKDQDL